MRSTRSDYSPVRKCHSCWWLLQGNFLKRWKAAGFSPAPCLQSTLLLRAEQHEVLWLRATLRFTVSTQIVLAARHRRSGKIRLKYKDIKDQQSVKLLPLSCNGHFNPSIILNTTLWIVSSPPHTSSCCPKHSLVVWICIYPENIVFNLNNISYSCCVWHLIFNIKSTFWMKITA